MVHPLGFNGGLSGCGGVAVDVGATSNLLVQAAIRAQARLVPVVSPPPNLPHHHDSACLSRRSGGKLPSAGLHTTGLLIGGVRTQPRLAPNRRVNPDTCTQTSSARWSPWLAPWTLSRAGTETMCWIVAAGRLGKAPPSLEFERWKLLGDRLSLREGKQAESLDRSNLRIGGCP